MSLSRRGPMNRTSDNKAIRPRILTFQPSPGPRSPLRRDTPAAVVHPPWLSDLAAKLALLTVAHPHTVEAVTNFVDKQYATHVGPDAAGEHRTAHTHNEPEHAIPRDFLDQLERLWDVRPNAVRAVCSFVRNEVAGSGAPGVNPKGPA